MVDIFLGKTPQIVENIIGKVAVFFYCKNIYGKRLQYSTEKGFLITDFQVASSNVAHWPGGLLPTSIDSEKEI